MQEFFSTLSIHDILSFLLFMVVSVLNYFGYRRNNKSSTEVLNMLKTRAPDYRQTPEPETVPEAQTFSSLVDQYVLNERTNELEKKADQLDIDQLIASHLDSALERVLARLMPDESPDDDPALDFTEVSDDLDFLSDAFEVVEDWREQLGLPDEMSAQEVFNQMDIRRKELQGIIEKNKGGNGNGKTPPSQDNAPPQTPDKPQA